MDMYDAIIVGSGPNGLAAGIRLAQAGLSVLILEGRQTIGGGTRTCELTLPGYAHDICSAVHPLGLASPFLRSLPLQDFGLQWCQPPVPLAHPLDGGAAVLIERDLDRTTENLGVDGPRYHKKIGPLVRSWKKLMADFLGPLPFPPRHPLAMTGFGWLALQSALGFTRRTFAGQRAPAAFAGMAGHAMLPLHKPGTAGFGLLLSVLAHAVGWPIAQGGSQAISQAMAQYFRSLGGAIRTGEWVQDIAELPPSRAVLLDITPRQLLAMAGRHLSPLYAWQLKRYRYGMGVCKVDYALDGPVPWAAASCTRAGTVHVGGTLLEIAAAEVQAWEGSEPEKPFVLLSQPSLFDAGRAPAGKHTVWAYCHVPARSTSDFSARIEAQIERFAPGFRDRILARRVHTSVEMEAYNPNYVGGDINGGVQDLRQLFTRPAIRWNPYRVPAQHMRNRPGSSFRRLYLCSSATPPGGGVHGMCGFHAAETALRDLN